VLIKRKNVLLRKEKRKKDKELKSRNSKEEMELEMDKILDWDQGQGNQSERTIQALKNTSQMILSPEKN